MAIQEGYLSTSVRWALFKADHPDAEIKFTEATAEQVGIPASFSKKDEKFCVATITRHPGDTIEIVGYKSVSAAGKITDSDAWHVLCSKAMGRALKKAGYPDTISDLKIMTRYQEIGSQAAVNNVVTTSAGSSNVSYTVTTPKSSVAGVNIETPTVATESKERPSKPSTDWSSDIERDEAHRNFKIRSNELNESDRETLRNEHAKLNNRQWPMSRGELNTLIILMEKIHAENEGYEEEHEVEEEEHDLVLTDGLKALFEMLTDESKEEITLAFGDPSTWADKVPEPEYAQMMDLFTIAAENEE
jgi:hypothetical protein